MRLAALFLVIALSGCAELEHVAVPVVGKRVDAFAGPVVVESVKVGALDACANPSGFLGPWDYLFLIRTGRTGWDSIASRSGYAGGLETLWKRQIQERFEWCGAFERNNATVRVRVRVSEAHKDMTQLWWVPLSWLATPIYTLAGGPNGGSRVRLQVAFNARGGPVEKNYEYSIDREERIGMWYGRDNQIGDQLAALCDRFVEDLRRDLAQAPPWPRPEEPVDEAK